MPGFSEYVARLLSLLEPRLREIFALQFVFTNFTLAFPFVYKRMTNKIQLYEN